MSMDKQSLPINFAMGLDTKTDPKQISPGKFLSLTNTIFSTQNLLAKRNGFARLTSLPDTSYSYLTTFNGNLTAIGTSLAAYNTGAASWVNKGSIQPAEIKTLPLIRSNLNQSQCDSVVADNGLICTVFTDNVPSGGSTVASYKYVVADSVTGQNIVAPTVIPVSVGVVTGSPRVFILGRYFIIVFSNVITATDHLQYIAININQPTSVSAESDISTSYIKSTRLNFDGYVVNDALYLAWNGADVGGAIRMTYIDSTLTQHNTVTFAGRVATTMSVTADDVGSTPVIYATFNNTATNTGYILAVNQQLNTVLAPTQWNVAAGVTNVATVATSGIAYIYYENTNAYSYDSGVATNFIRTRTCTQAGSLSAITVLVRSVGLASKAFILGGVRYFLSVYSSPEQPTYFLIDQNGKVIVKLAYSNGGSYLATGLPNITVTNSTVQIPYLIKDLLSPVNKTQGVSNFAAIYSQTGVNLSSITIGTEILNSAEIGSDLHLTGGFLWMYDGYAAVEHGFHLWPDSVEVTGSTTGGTMTAQQYFYQAIYEWSDNQGNIHRSAPSIPVTVTTTGSTSSVTVNVPTYRLTYKTANPVKIVIFRWSTAQQTYYQVTSVAIPTLNDTTADSVAFVDTQPDSAILGNSIIYTTGGVIENIGAPAAADVSLFKSRLFLLDAEDRNLLWYSKQVIETTPVEMSDLFTIYVAPTIGSEGSTGDCNFTYPMDDKLLIFKDQAQYYITGTGPDNTGANNDFSEPIFITATVGSANKKSVVTIPHGVMYQSKGKGIWLTGRDLATVYIGSPVEAFNDFEVLSADNIPGTNQVRFVLSNGYMLMYDHYYAQWGSFVGVPAISSTTFQSMQTFINQYGQVYQERADSYLDGSNPVLISFKTGWMNLAGLQGFERAYFFYLIGEYLSPHMLTVSIAYDYAPEPSQVIIISPDNYSAPYGGDSLYGGSEVYGGAPSLEQWRVFFEQQKCQAFQIQLSESFDASFGTMAGAGLTLSGLNMIIGLKSNYPRLRASRSVG